MHIFCHPKVRIQFIRDQFWPSCIVLTCICPPMCACQPRPCPRCNLLPVQSRFTKLGTVQTPWLRSYCLGGWLTMTLKVHWNLKIKKSPFWTCPLDKSSPIEVWICKFGTKMPLSILKIPIYLELDWHWPASSCLIVRHIFLQTELMVYI